MILGIIFLAVSLAYLIGSIPTSVWVSRIHFGIDIRKHGSGSASHLNVHRVLGWKAATIVRIIDVAKGFLVGSTGLGFDYYLGLTGSQGLVLPLTLGLATVLGHIFSIFVGFRGGKGVHCAFGVLLAVNPTMALVCGSGAVFVWIVTRYRNLGYLAASTMLPAVTLAMFPLFPGLELILLVFSLLMSFLLWWTHYPNFLAILSGREPKMQPRFLGHRGGR